MVRERRLVFVSTVWRVSDTSGIGSTRLSRSFGDVATINNWNSMDDTIAKLWRSMGSRYTFMYIWIR